MKTLLDLLLKSAHAIVALVIAVAVIAVAAFLGARYANGTAAPTTVRSLGPTVKQLEGMGQLVSMRVHITDVLAAEGEGYRGSWLIKGDALLACDMSRAVIVDKDEQTRKASIRLPRPRALSARVDHEKTKTWSVEKATWIPWKWGNENVFRDSAMYHAQRLVEEAACAQDNITNAKVQAELVVRKAYDMVDWSVVVVWEQDAQQGVQPDPDKAVK